MAKGKRCPQCGNPMYALREDDQPQGTWVTYQCRNGNCRFEERIFEQA